MARRNPDCPRYFECLDEAARLDVGFNCNRCPKEKIIRPGPTVNQPGTGQIKEKKMEPNEKKTCIKCGNEFPKTEEYFRKSSSTRDGFEGQCKDCRKKYFANYRDKKRANEKVQRDRHHKISHDRRKKNNSANMVIARSPLIMATPEEIIKALRKGVALEIIQEIIQKIREKFA